MVERMEEEGGGGWAKEVWWRRRRRLRRMICFSAVHVPFNDIFYFIFNNLWRIRWRRLWSLGDGKEARRSRNKMRTRRMWKMWRRIIHFSAVYVPFNGVFHFVFIVYGEKGRWVGDGGWGGGKEATRMKKRRRRRRRRRRKIMKRKRRKMRRIIINFPPRCNIKLEMHIDKEERE